MAHEVEPEAVDLVLARPGDDGVDHQLLHHPVLAGGVRAARRRLDGAGGRQTVVVAGHDPVEHALGILTRRRRVVVDDVHDDPQSRPVQRGDHRAELEGPTRTFRIGRVGALWRRVVPRVVAPVEPVGGRHRGDARLLLLRVGLERLEIAGRRGLVGAALGDRGDVEHRQQVHGVEAGVGERRAGAACRRCRCR